MNLLFHARHSAKKREYEYIILNRVAKPSFDVDRVWLVKKKLNIKSMKEGAKYFKGKHDFTAFRSSSCSAKSPIRTINDLKILKKKRQNFHKHYFEIFFAEAGKINCRMLEISRRG